jgi:hypothetical protein
MPAEDLIGQIDLTTFGIIYGDLLIVPLRNAAGSGSERNLESYSIRIVQL